MFSWLIEFMQNSLKFIYGFVGNYGLAIIIFTLIIKLLLYPLTAKQTRSMKAMQDLQPELEKIKDKYDDDKEEQQKKMMELYKENNVNPAAGCLPMIFQLAILIPLYRAIFHMGETMTNANFLWITSLADPDVAIVIINALAMVAQTYITQKVSGSGSNSKMMWIMPLFILFIGFQIPSGILLYWLTSTIFTAGQQYFLSRESNVKEAVEK
jgi:YidC/Oxa1 family membrane protein insertase